MRRHAVGRRADAPRRPAEGSHVAALREDLDAASRPVDALERTEAIGDADFRAAACGTHLLRFYSALEQAFERIAEAFNGGVPAGSTWHRELLLLMARAVPDVRPAVLTRPVVEQLDEYRKFRHRVLRPAGRTRRAAACTTGTSLR